MFWKLTWKTFWQGKSQKLANTGVWGIQLVFRDSLICDTFLLSFATVSLHFRWHIPGPFAAIPYGRILFHPSFYVCVYESVKHEEYMPQIITSWAPALPRPETVKWYLFWYVLGFFFPIWGRQFALDFMLKLCQIFGPSTTHQWLLFLGRMHLKLGDSHCKCNTPGVGAGAGVRPTEMTAATSTAMATITTTRHLAQKCNCYKLCELCVRLPHAFA